MRQLLSSILWVGTTYVDYSPVALFVGDRESHQVILFTLSLLQELLDEAGRESYTTNVGKLAVNRVKNRSPQVLPCKFKRELDWIFDL